MKCPECGVEADDFTDQCKCGYGFYGEPVLTLEGLGWRPKAYRDGKTLVIPFGVSLPDYCIRCGRPEHGALIFKEYSWPLSKSFHLLHFLLPEYIGPLAMMPTEQTVVSFVLCERHRGYYRRMKWITALLFSSFIPTGIILGDWDWVAIPVLAMFLGGVVTATIACGPLWAMKIADGEGRFRGAGAGFLDLLPRKR